MSPVIIIHQTIKYNARAKENILINLLVALEAQQHDLNEIVIERVAYLFMHLPMERFVKRPLESSIATYRKQNCTNKWSTACCS